jgi:hypothetical protein
MKNQPNSKHRHTPVWFLVVILFSGLSGCVHNDIQLEKVTSTSDALQCNTVFAESRKAIVEMNEILVQLGNIDTLEDSAPPAAIIHHQGKEIILNLTKSIRSTDHAEDYYAGKGYKLALNYTVKYTDIGINNDNYKDPYYVGECQVWHGKFHSKINVVGLKNKL